MSPEKWSSSPEHPLISARYAPHLAYENASSGACLALVARKEDRLREVAAIAQIIGSPRAIFISLFEDFDDITNAVPVMDQITFLPLVSAENCAKAIVDGAFRGEKYLTVPSWAEVTLLWKVPWPEIPEWCNRLLLITRAGTPQREAASK
ncbi:hypothetical protein SLEP1_g3652 [Rubroshorea leprosula]|uniref:Uncharacterized protein n=1 Tax=Rubroshorea leprosula TaxID=152421 RepID=A0AAV5HVQ3_9ROSI|nr:hypothetical protein SLEP1_g3652 [Rubroshorea leprosula]